MDLRSAVDDLVHPPTQVHDDRIDCTLDAVFRISSPGAIDFGGGELEAAATERIAPAKRDPADDYGWWDLDGGQYCIALNETLDAPEPVSLQPRRDLVERGASHPTLRVRTLPRLPLTVPETGLHLKENARVSTLIAP